MKGYYNSSNELSGGRLRFLFILGLLLFLIGLASLIFSVIDLFQGKPSYAQYDQSQGGLQIENPLWPSSGKGFWVGLVLMAAGLLGIVASREGSRSSIIGFAALSAVATILSFYMMITCIIPIQYNTYYSSQQKARWQSNELILNSLLIAAGALGTIVGAITSIVGCIYSGCCVDQRDAYKYSLDKNMAAPGTPGSMRFPAATAPRMNYPYQQRMPM